VGGVLLLLAALLLLRFSLLPCHLRLVLPAKRIQLKICA
jgi:hypothetical protein